MILLLASPSVQTTHTHSVMHIAWVVTPATQRCDGLAARVGHLEAIVEVLFVPATVLPVLEQVCPTTVILKEKTDCDQ